MRKRRQLQKIDLDTQVAQLVDQVVQEQDPNKVKDLTELFNASINKKNMVRLAKLNSLLDKTTDQALERFETQPDQFSNKELLDYINVVSTINDKATSSLKDATLVPVQLHQNNVNINIDPHNITNLTRESRQRILDVVNSMLDNKNLEPIDIMEEVIDESQTEETDRQDEQTI